jgi:hypothetical protein
MGIDVRLLFILVSFLNVACRSDTVDLIAPNTLMASGNNAYPFR